MSRSQTYRLPWPPSVNNYIRRNAKCSYMTKQGKAFRNEAVQAVREALGAEPQSLMGRVAVSIELTLPDRRKRDIDNHIKAVLDSLQQSGAIWDDEQVDEIRVKRLHVEPPGCCDVTITELTSGSEVKHG